MKCSDLAECKKIVEFLLKENDLLLTKETSGVIEFQNIYVRSKDGHLVKSKVNHYPLCLSHKISVAEETYYEWFLDMLTWQITYVYDGCKKDIIFKAPHCEEVSSLEEFLLKREITGS